MCSRDPSRSRISIPIFATPSCSSGTSTCSRRSRGYVATVAYVGNRGDHLFQSYQKNPARPGAGSVDSRRIYAPAFGPITTFASVAESTYHALQLSVNKRLTHGFTVLASYTWSRFVDTASGDGDGGSNPFDLSADKGTSDLDIPHVFVASFVYDLPKLQTASRLSATSSAAGRRPASSFSEAARRFPSCPDETTRNPV